MLCNGLDTRETFESERDLRRERDPDFTFNDILSLKRTVFQVAVYLRLLLRLLTDTPILFPHLCH